MARRITPKTKSRTWWGQHQSSICSSALPTDIDYLRKFGASTSTHSASHHILKYVPGELAADGSEDLSRLSADRRSPCRHWEARRHRPDRSRRRAFRARKSRWRAPELASAPMATGRQDHDLYRHGRRHLVWRRHDAEKRTAALRRGGAA